MEEVFELADRVSVLRDGQFIGCMKVADASREQLINMMVGREVEGGYLTNTAKKGEVVLELKNFTRKGVFEDVNLKVRAGEILGLAGLVGAGRSEVMRALVGYDKLDFGEIYLEGKQITIRHPQDAIKHHFVKASEDRKELGLVLCRNIKENVSLQNFDKLSGAAFIQKPKERKLAKEYTEKISIPALIIHGEKDSIITYESARELYEMIPNAEFATVDGAGHMPNFTHPQEYNVIITHYMAEQLEDELEDDVDETM